MADATRLDGDRTGSTRVLVPLDGSPLAEQAIPFARALAGSDGDLVFLHVIPEPEPMRALLGEVAATADDVLRVEQEAAQAMLRDAASRWGAVLGAEPQFEVAPGDPAETILAVADRLGSRFVVIASHGRGAVGRLAYGSVADRIARTSTVPVLIVRPRDAEAEIEPAEIQRLVVPLDGSPLSAEALPVAEEIARHLNVPVHLIQAISPGSMLMPSPMGAGAYQAEIYTELEQELTAEARANLDGAAKHLTDAGIQTTTAVLEAPPVIAIEDALEERDIVVMSSHGRSGVRRWLLGSVAEKLVRTGSAPVLLVPASARVKAARQ